MDEVDATTRLREERTRLGKCPSCGQQLYSVEQTSSCCGLLGKGEVKKPLSVPQLVDRGQCLKCSPNDPSADFEHPLMSSIEKSRMERILTDETDSVSDTIPPLPKTVKFKESTTGPSQATNVGFTGHLSSPTATKLRAPPSICKETTPAASTAVYNGSYNSRGQKHGEGSMTWSNGDKYVGCFVEDKRHGMGTLTFAPMVPSMPDNGEYVGEWKHNQMHGEGTRRYANGDVYVGHYEYGKRHGEGRFYYANGDMYWGPWRDNQMHGPVGRYYYSSGQSFEGTFVASRRTGKGKVQKADGSIEIFQYINDERVGQGVRWNSDRNKAWRLWMPRNHCSQPSVPNAMEREPIKASEAKKLMMEIEEASRNCLEDMPEM